MARWRYSASRNHKPVARQTPEWRPLQTSRNRREDVAAMKRVADRLQKVFLVRNVVEFGVVI